MSDSPDPQHMSFGSHHGRVTNGLAPAAIHHHHDNHSMASESKPEPSTNSIGGTFVNRVISYWQRILVGAITTLVLGAVYQFLPVSQATLDKTRTAVTADLAKISSDLQHSSDTLSGRVGALEVQQADMKTALAGISEDTRAILSHLLKQKRQETSAPSGPAPTAPHASSAKSKTGAKKRVPEQTSWLARTFR